MRSIFEFMALQMRLQDPKLACKESQEPIKAESASAWGLASVCLEWTVSIDPYDTREYTKLTLAFLHLPVGAQNIARRSSHY